MEYKPQPSHKRISHPRRDRNRNGTAHRARAKPLKTEIQDLRAPTGGESRGVENHEATEAAMDCGSGCAKVATEPDIASVSHLTPSKAQRTQLDLNSSNSRSKI